MVHLFLHIWTKPCFSRAPQLWTMVAWDHRLRGLLYTQATVLVGVMQVQNNFVGSIKDQICTTFADLDSAQRRPIDFWIREFLSADSNKQLKCFTSETGFRIALLGPPDQSLLLFTFLNFYFIRAILGLGVVQVDCYAVRQLCQIVQKYLEIRSACIQHEMLWTSVVTLTWSRNHDFFFIADSGWIALQVIYIWWGRSFSGICRPFQFQVFRLRYQSSIKTEFPISMAFCSFAKEAPFQISFQITASGNIRALKKSSIVDFVINQFSKKLGICPAYSSL